MTQVGAIQSIQLEDLVKRCGLILYSEVLNKQYLRTISSSRSSNKMIVFLERPCMLRNNFQELRKD